MVYLRGGADLADDEVAARISRVIPARLKATTTISALTRCRLCSTVESTFIPKMRTARTTPLNRAEKIRPVSVR